MRRTIVDIHILQTVPPSNLNRDDTGSPKTAVYGGVRRARVSSQAWKRATRKAFAAELDPNELGVRTKQVAAELAARIRSAAPELSDQADELAKVTLNTAGIKTAPVKGKVAEESGYLLFLSRRQYDNLAQAAIASAGAEGGVSAGLKQHNTKALANRDHSIDVALFGRMVADASDINVDAAAQVAHAISVHAVDNEYDYFTAVDDRKEDDSEAGAGMIGTVEFNSATLYRYATLDVDRLRDNLGDDEATRRASEAFLRAFACSMPTGKQNTFANRTLPDAVIVRIRDTQPVSLVGAFEKPVVADPSSGRLATAAEELAAYTHRVEEVWDQRPVASWVVHVGVGTQALAGLGEEVSLPELVKAVGEEIAGRLTESA